MANNTAPKLDIAPMQNLTELFNISDDDTSFSDMSFEPDFLIASAQPFPNHPFQLYSGERLDDLVESIKQNGVMQPIIVRKMARRYEILAGHNRVHASKIAGLSSIPAVIFHQISDEEALSYVIESNLMQRSFSDMRHSEKAAVIALHHAKMFSQGKRNDIQKHLEIIEKASNGGQNKTCAQVGHKLKSRDLVANEYGLSRNTIARYLRINKLIHTLKIKVDDSSISFLSAVTLSFLNEKEQEVLNQCLDLNSFKVDMKKSEVLRDYSEKHKLDEDTIYLILNGDLGQPEKKSSNRTPSIGRSTYKKYFHSGQSQKEVQSVIDKALALYFSQIESEE